MQVDPREAAGMGTHRQVFAVHAVQKPLMCDQLALSHEELSTIPCRFSSDKDAAVTPGVKSHRLQQASRHPHGVRMSNTTVSGFSQAADTDHLAMLRVMLSTTRIQDEQSPIPSISDLQSVNDQPRLQEEEEGTGTVWFCCNPRDAGAKVPGCRNETTAFSHGTDQDGHAPAASHIARGLCCERASLPLPLPFPSLSHDCA